MYICIYVCIYISYFSLTGGKSPSIWRADKAAPSVLLGGGPPRKQKHVTEPTLTGRLLHEQQGFNDAGQEGRPNNRFDRFKGLSSYNPVCLAMACLARPGPASSGPWYGHAC